MYITIQEECTKERTQAIEEEKPVHETQEDVRLGNLKLL
jgi:hypothetical protein